MAPYLGGGLALLLGGAVLAGMSRWDFSAIPWLGALAPWQVVFLVVSVPGLIVSGVADDVERAASPIQSTA